MVEMLISTAITGLIVSVLGTAVFQGIDVSRYGNDRLTAMHELQNIALWFNLDGQRAVSATVDGDLSLNISESLTITYTVNGTELRRIAGGSQMTLARNISSASFSSANRTVTLTVTSSPEGRHNINEQGSYKVTLRPSGE